MTTSVRPGRFPAALVAVTAAVATQLVSSCAADVAADTATPPPAHAAFDYQIGGAYPPPPGVRIVSRDREASPAAGLYNICYVNAFQVQPGAEDEWDADLLLRDAAGDVVYDQGWDEALLDLRTDDKRRRIADKVNGWIDGCAEHGFQAVEPDNYDSFSRSGNLLDEAEALAYIKLLSAHAHDRGLAIGQKNTAELSGYRDEAGLDFAVAEECGENEECAVYAEAFDDLVIVIEYTDGGLATACSGWSDRLSIVRRDLAVSPAGSGGYARRTC